MSLQTALKSTEIWATFYVLWKIAPHLRSTDRKSTIALNFNLDRGITNLFMADDCRLLTGL